MSTVRINPKIKEKVTPILAELGLSVSEAINIFLHQVKLNNGIPFEIKRKIKYEPENNCSYVCEYGYKHKYNNKINIEELENEAKKGKTYSSAKEMIDDILNEE